MAKAKKKEIPVLVKVISVFQFIGAGVNLMLGLLFIVGAGFMAQMLKSVPGLGALGAGLFVVIGIFLVVMGLLAFFVGRGLWLGHNWARIVAIIINGLGFLSGLGMIFMGSWISIVGLIINGLVAGYLLLSDEVKQSFE